MDRAAGRPAGTQLAARTPYSVLYQQGWDSTLAIQITLAASSVAGLPLDPWPARWHM